ncbi:Mycothiol maleylpyruvate isomerase N-terminal domain-containing protein [Sanguibacter gelidistatuariae]|uniref:Mycothiol maleylpyruvate isomerase N-terminal domain-containing protein n=1 Tax=Sanguibacter gelidistatuariae TaxID=1814289 RepID=A0A1G6HRW1_9MICO|nr:maleylpyruvate isomerase N-terminal domain-containing protein [Sanguibacter gelidistatuariae]SDB96970.1 Mycothiol maleylpyruvate isomerase N-terminal domain-containing protein [Sanguibacter gelidistatuariae]
MTADLPQITSALHTQWARLRSWVGPLGDNLLGNRNKPSALPGWTVGELVAHLGRAMDALAVCTPAPAGTRPIELAEYLGSYPERADDISQFTRDLAVEIADAPLAAVDALATRALATLDELSLDQVVVVQARRGAITLRDMAMSRLIELVVHAEDLVASLKGVVDSAGPANPIDREAQRIVAEELLDIVVTRGGWDLEVTDPGLWIRLATGRARYNVDDLARAITTDYTAGGVPDLGRMLPIL